MVDSATETSESDNLSPEALMAMETGDAPDDRDALEMLLEEVSQQIVLASVDDLSTLGTIDTTLEHLGAELKGSRPLAFKLVEAIKALVEKIILEEVDLECAPLDLAARGVATLQRLCRSFSRLGHEVVEEPELLAELSNLSEVAILPAVAEAAPAAASLEVQTAAPVPAAPAGNSLDLSEVDPGIFADFAVESEQHLAAAESTLLSLEANPTDEEMLNTVFRAFHTIKGGASFLNLHDIVHVAHAIEDILDSARRGQQALNSAILDVVLEAIDLLKVLLKSVSEQLQGNSAATPDVAGFLARVANASQGKLAAGAAAPPPVQPDTASPNPVLAPAQADAETPHPVPAQPEAAHRQPDQHFVRVGTDKLDQLVNMVGELVITQTQVTQSPTLTGVKNQKLTKDISQLSKISKDIQEIAMALRMVPIRGTFERMARTVRDLARKCDKEVELQMAGEDTDLDKNVVEELVDPLTHMVRNAVDHGIEGPEARRAAGKPEKGVVKLEACHRGGNIVIELKDDGKGLNREKIHQKAVERGLIRPEHELSEAEVFELIFHPGFSTADKISDISGRGVGMDVVKRSIEKLRGKVEVTSQPGQGSTFTIRLPLTLAIIDGMVINVGDQRYILPLTSIVRSLRPMPGDVFTVMGKGEMVKVQDDLFPLVRFYRRFGVKPRCEDPTQSLVVLVEAEGHRYCLLVDELLGMQQVVIKGLEEELRGERCLSGCAILGDGKVGLILDPAGLVPAGSNGKTAWREPSLATANA